MNPIIIGSLKMETNRIDQLESSPINPLDLDLRSDREDYTPDTIAENDWMYVNEAIEEAPTRDKIAVRRPQWEAFIEGFDTPEELAEQSWSEDQMDTVVDKRQFLYTVDTDGFTHQTWDRSMNYFLEERDLDEFERFLPTAISHEDIHDLTSRVDDGSDYSIGSKWASQAKDQSDN